MTRRTEIASRVVVISLLAVCPGGCEEASQCTPGDRYSCTCDGHTPGTNYCSSSGTWLGCTCNTADDPDDYEDDWYDDCGGGGGGWDHPNYDENCTDDGEDHFDPADCPDIAINDPGIRYVDADADDSGNGLSWSGSFKTVQEGIDSARCAAIALGTPAQVWVAEGTYEVYTACTTDTVRLRQHVDLFGGFAGDETSLEERDWAAHEAVLDGLGKAYHVLTGAAASSIDGITVTGGNAATWKYDPIRAGGGLLHMSGSMEIAHSRFVDNEAYHYESWHDWCEGEDVVYSWGEGGAIYVDSGAELTVSDSTFEGNRAIDGGAIFHKGSVDLTGCSFTSNHARTMGGAIQGRAHAEITECAFEGNASDYGGAIYTWAGLLVRNSRFSDNSGAFGGAVGYTAMSSGHYFYDSVFERNKAYEWCDEWSEWDYYCDEHGGAGGAIAAYQGPLAVMGCLFDGNEATSGGAFYAEWANTPYEFTNSTFVNNIAQSPEWAVEDNGIGGAIFTNLDAGTATVVSSVFWNNTASSNDNFFGNVESTYSLVEGGWDGDGNIDGDPLFVDAEGGDFSLLPGSPCIDAADGEAAPEFDIDGNPRVDDPDSPNTGIGPPWAEMGAYEYQPE